MMDEQYLINILKEKLCYVSLDFVKDMEITKTRGVLNTIQCDYVLPDYVTTHVGYVKEVKPPSSAPSTETPSSNNHPADPMQVDKSSELPQGNAEPPKKGEEQLLRMNNERITVPEILFNPSFVGMYCVMTCIDIQKVSLRRVLLRLLNRASRAALVRYNTYYGRIL